jgi:DNA-binding NtrC family response regulator
MSKTIMIVEEDQHFHGLYTDMLEETDYRIVHAYNGNEALSRVEKEKPDLIIFDILLDMVTGDTFFLHLKGMPEYADIPVIIVTNALKCTYVSLWEIDPNLVILDKADIGENLIVAIEAEIGEQNLALAH